MFEPFLIALRESLQCAALLALVLFYPPVRENRRYTASLVLGVSTAFLLGFSIGNLSFLSKNLLKNETWTFWRYLVESILFYLGVVFIVIRKPKASPLLISAGLFLLGFSLFFFESRGLGFIIHDIGIMNERAASALILGLAGMLAGLTPLVVLKNHLHRLPLEKAFNLPSLLMVLGALQFGFGGLGELEKENILVPLQRGLTNIICEAVKSAQSVLLIPEHRFLKVAFSGLAGYLASDRTALTVTVLFIMAPPLFILIKLFSRPDPVVGDIRVSAQRRHKIAFFRKELSLLTTPVLTVFIVLVVLLHAVNISLNPLYDPAPIPIREGEHETSLKIPISSKMGDLTDKKLRKYVYYNRNEEILFLAVLKPDGSIGVALDQCEVCRPADWNKDAKGYAQKGAHLICKYCMTPIAASTINTPGGCNPIPLPFRVADNNIVILLNDLIGTFDRAEALDKKGTHL